MSTVGLVSRKSAPQVFPFLLEALMTAMLHYPAFSLGFQRREGDGYARRFLGQAERKNGEN